MYFANSCNYLSSLVNYCKILFLHREGQGFIGQNTWRHDGWWTIQNSYKESCCGRGLYSGFDKLVQVQCQLYLFSMCQAMPTSLYMRWELDSDSGKLKPRQNKSKSFKIMVIE